MSTTIEGVVEDVRGHVREIYSAWQLRAAGVPLFILLTFLGSQVAIPLPPYMIPATLQTLAVFCAALCLGPLFGSVSMGIYLLLGMVGLPMFAEGESGVSIVVGQTGGYLVAFIAVPWIIAPIVRRRDGSIRGWGAMALSIVAATGFVFLIGVPWLKFVGGISWADAWWHGCVVFWPLTALKAIAAVWIGKIAAPWASKRIW